MPAKSTDNHTDGAEAPAGKSGRKTILWVAIAMIVEGAAIGGVAWFTRPADVSAEEFAVSQQQELDRIIELPLLEERLANSKQGVTYIYDTKIIVRVRNRYREYVEAYLTDNTGQITAAISAIWRTAEPRYFDEPHLNTLTRQTEAALRPLLGEDEQTQESRLDSVIITKMIGYRGDY